MVLQSQHVLNSTLLTASAHASLPPISVTFGRKLYGFLVTANVTGGSAAPTLPLVFVSHIAQVCGWILYAIEETTFVQGQVQMVQQQIREPLTKQQCEVLQLMCQGYDQEEIAATLHIAPSTVAKHRHRMYAKLGVHNEYEAQRVAYQMGLFSPLTTIIANQDTL